MVLRLVHPAPAGQQTDPPRRRHAPSPSLLLAPEEVRHLRATIRNVARAHYGTIAALARALGVSPDVLTRKMRPSPGLAVALWRLTKIPLETILGGGLSAVPTQKSSGEDEAS